MIYIPASPDHDDPGESVCKFYSAANISSFFSYESVFVDPINVLVQTSVCMLTFGILNFIVTKYSCQKRTK